MKKALLIIFITGLFEISAFSQTEFIAVLEGIKIKNEKRAEALYYYEKNWKLLREKALAKGFIHSYEFIEIEDNGETDLDIILITRYADNDQFESSEYNFQNLIKEFITDKGGLKLKNELSPVDFRQNVFVVKGRSSLMFQTKSVPMGTKNK